MRHEAVIKLYPNVHNQVNDKAFDVNGNEISIDENAVNTEVSNMLSKVPMRLLREERNRRLAETDWRFRSDLTPSQEWIDYSQALRDLPATFSPVIDILMENGDRILKEQTDWPTKPA